MRQKPKAKFNKLEEEPKKISPKVYVMRSPCGYVGNGEFICEAYGDKVLVKIDDIKFNKIITVKKTDLKKM